MKYLLNYQNTGHFLQLIFFIIRQESLLFHPYQQYLKPTLYLWLIHLYLFRQHIHCSGNPRLVLPLLSLVFHDFPTYELYRFYYIRILIFIFFNNICRTVSRSIIMNQYFKLKVRFLHQKAIKTLPQIFFMIIYEATNTNHYFIAQLFFPPSIPYMAY